MLKISGRALGAVRVYGIWEELLASAITTQKKTNEHQAYEQKCRLCHLLLQWTRLKVALALQLWELDKNEAVQESRNGFGIVFEAVQ